VINDQGGPGSSGLNTVPTMSRWMMVLMGLLLVLSAAVAERYVLWYLPGDTSRR
jgi:hypothetical protein